MRERTILLGLIFCASLANGVLAPQVSGETEKRTICELQHVSLSKGMARVTRGLPELPAFGYDKAPDKKFPDSIRMVNDGCVTDLNHPEDFPKEAEVLYCPKCRAAGEHWLARHWRN